MPSFKDHLHAFKLACEAGEREADLSSLKPPSHYDLQLKRLYFDSANSEICALFSTTIALFIDNQLHANEANFPPVYLRCPDEAIGVYLEHVVAEISEREPDHAGRSRSLEKIAGKLQDTLKVDFDIKAKSDAEHEASDRGARDGARLFIDTILPAITAGYAERFPPQDHPYGQTTPHYFSPPPTLM